MGVDIEIKEGLSKCAGISTVLSESYLIERIRTIQPRCASGNQPYPPRSGPPSPSGKASLKPYDRTSPVEMHLFENHTTKANALRKCNSSVGSADTFHSRARLRPACGPLPGKASTASLRVVFSWVLQCIINIYIYRMEWDGCLLLRVLMS